MKHEATRAVPEHPALPAWKSFVVQFSRETDPAQPSGAFAGRVEHLSSGRRAHFDSPQALVEILRQLLEELGKAPS